MIGVPCVLEAATEQDVPALLRIERSSYSHPWSERSLRDAVGGGSGAQVLVLRQPGNGGPERGIVAYCAWQRVADELHIHNLAVHPGRRARGLGRAMLRAVLGLAATRGACQAFLEVRSGNAPARRLYEAEGFEAVGVRPAYYESPREDALLLRKAPLRAPVDS